MKSKLKKQSYIVIGAVLAVAIGYPLCAFLPKMRSISLVRREIRQKQDFVAQTEKMRPMVAEQKAALSSTYSYIESERARLAQMDKISQVYSQISQLANRVGATTTRFEPHSAILYDHLAKVPVQFGVSGSTAAVQQLLAEIERLPYNIWVEGLKLETAGEDGKDTRAAFDLAIFVDNRDISD